MAARNSSNFIFIPALSCNVDIQPGGAVYLDHVHGFFLQLYTPDFIFNKLCSKSINECNKEKSADRMQTSSYHYACKTKLSQSQQRKKKCPDKAPRRDWTTGWAKVFCLGLGQNGAREIWVLNFSGWGFAVLTVW